MSWRPSLISDLQIPTPPYRAWKTWIFPAFSLWQSISLERLHEEGFSHPSSNTAWDNSQGPISAWTKSVFNHSKKLGKFPQKNHHEQLEVVYSRKKPQFFFQTHLWFHQMIFPQIPGVKQRFVNAPSPSHQGLEVPTPALLPSSPSLSLRVLSIPVFVRREMKLQNSSANSQQSPLLSLWNELQGIQHHWWLTKSLQEDPPTPNIL